MRARPARPGLARRGVPLVVSAMFVVLALALNGLLTIYSDRVLRPRLETEALSQAKILASSQAGFLASAIRAAEKRGSAMPLARAIDELLVLRDPASGTPYFDGIETQVDYDVVDVQRGSFDLERGENGTAGGFRVEVPLFDVETSELVGLAKVRVTDRFFLQLNSDVHRELVRIAWIGLGVMTLLWGTLLVVVGKLQRQTFERHRAERELWQQERKYQRLVDSLSTYFVYRKDAGGRLVEVGRSVNRVLGWDEKTFVSRFADAFAPAGYRSPTDGSEGNFDCRLEDQAGRHHHLELSEVAAVDPESGETVGYDGIARDVTAQHEIQEQLRHAKEQAEIANRAKSQFLANMSHEIRTPLNAVLGMTSLALKTELDTRQRQYLEKIRASGRLLVEIIEDILDLSRIEAGRLEMQVVAFDLDDLLRELANVVGVRAGAKDLEIVIDRSPTCPRLLIGDPVRLQQVLMNLVNNAVKFTPSGEVVVAIELVEVRRERAELRFSVRDTGIGIAADALDGLFEPFTQADSSMTRRYGGAGLGLAISRRLVELMNGSLEAESAPGEGSTFTFTATLGVPAERPPVWRLAEGFRHLPVLVADDNATARAALAEMLRALTLQVTVVESGEAAVSAIRLAAQAEDPFRLVLVDWKMPGLDGTETVRRLRDDPQLAGRTPSCILVTAYDAAEAARRAEQAGIDVVLHKPVSPSALHDAVVRALLPDGSAVREPDREPAPLLFAPGQRVLVAEDNAINSEVTSEMLSQAGLEVVVASDGSEAIRLARTASFDAVLMDVQMPEIGGLEATRVLRADQRLRELPIIAMTAHAMLGDRERFLAGGMSDYVSKPVDEEELLRVLGRWLRVSPLGSSRTSRPAAFSRQVPGLDLADGLRRASGNRATYLRLLGDFARDGESLLVRIDSTLRGGDLDSARAALHTLKGSAGTMGARRVAAAAADLERVLQSGATTADDSLRELGAAFAEARAGAEELISSIDSERAPTPGPATMPEELESATRQAIRRLALQLADGNLAARGTFDELRGLTGDAASAAFADLEASLQRLDFEAARRWLDEVERALLAADGGRE